MSAQVVCAQLQDGAVGGVDESDAGLGHGRKTGCCITTSDTSAVWPHAVDGSLLAGGPVEGQPAALRYRCPLQECSNHVEQVLSQLTGAVQVWLAHRRNTVDQTRLDVPATERGAAVEALLVAGAPLAHSAHEIERGVPSDVNH
ncbi:hypothetical protein ASG91_16315 [Phycicoccus sp. Soil802]|nr:hypothetical protein ASG91_16315 [Phycicoccus sp. Soil802]